MWAFETIWQKEGKKRIAGVDEAGRGPLAGPVVAAAVILAGPIEGVNDSKKLTERQREKLYVQIMERAVAVGVGSASHEEIDAINILRATFLAIDRACDKILFDHLLIDGNRYQGKYDRSSLECIIRGDQLSQSIAAASIVAKVTRDRIMAEIDAHYPQFGFARHKGYPTKAHFEALAVHGPCPIHRATFLD